MQSLLRRKQFVSINNVNSNIESNNYGMAPGFPLGLFLFLLYINDLHSSTSILPRLFAYDTCFIINNRNKKFLETEMNKNLSYAFNLCCVNKPSLNLKKSSYVIILSKSNTKLSQISLTMNDITIYSHMM